jgi:hypothetical protein
VPMSRNLVALTLLDPSGPAWPVMGVLYLYLTLCYTIPSEVSKQDTMCVVVFVPGFD